MALECPTIDDLTPGHTQTSTVECGFAGYNERSPAGGDRASGVVLGRGCWVVIQLVRWFTPPL